MHTDMYKVKLNKLKQTFLKILRLIKKTDNFYLNNYLVDI